MPRRHQFARTQILPISTERAWEFFSSPENLGKITPSRMNFVIHSSLEGRIFKGQLIRYRVTVLPLLRVTWVTQITEVIEGTSFTDEQRQGPYAMWRHTHTFREINGRTEMRDVVEYALPLGWVGRLAHALFVEREVKRIFDYRYKVLEKLFIKS